MSKLFSYLKELLIIFVLAFILAMVLKTFVIDNRVIPTSSMVPTVPVDSRILVNRFIYRFEDIEFQDIIVFEPTDDTKAEVHQDDDMLKRVIGLPGDIVEIQNGTLYINGNAIEEPYIAEQMNYDYGPIVVPEDSVFVLGDNRNESFDSHAWSNPYVPMENVKGKAFWLYWPKENFGKLE